MTYLEKAKQLVDEGLKSSNVYKFFEELEKDQRDTLGVVLLFVDLGVKYNVISSMYEEWQDLN